MALDINLAAEQARRLWNTGIGGARLAVVLSGTAVVAGGGILALSFQPPGGSTSANGFVLGAAMDDGGDEPDQVTGPVGRPVVAAPGPAGVRADERPEDAGAAPASTPVTTGAAPTTTVTIEATPTTGGSAVTQGTQETAPAHAGGASMAGSTAQATAPPTAPAPADAVVPTEPTTTTVVASSAPAPTFATEWPTLVPTTPTGG